MGGGYGYGYPGWLGYPYVLDPGWYDWGNRGDSGDAQMLAPDNRDNPDAAYYGGDGPSPSAPDYPPYPNQSAGQGYIAPQPPPESASSPATPQAEEHLTVMFKSGRAPQTMQNYMLNGSTLTDLDRQHYELIPLDQIDVAATQQANRPRGVDFEIPAKAHE